MLTSTDLSVLEKPRYEDFDIEYRSGNSFGFLGNGFCTRELDGVSPFTIIADSTIYSRDSHR
jgi:hypothetical protein